MTGNMTRQAVVTGGVRGIGGAIARGLAEAGYEVLATALSEEETAAMAPHPRIRTAVLDVRDNAAVTTLMAGLSRLDALVAAAGTIRRGGAEFDAEVFAEVLDVNLTGTMRVCTAARPLLAESRGAVVTVASMLSIFGGPLVPGYTASKGGIAQLTKSLAVAWAKDGIRVNAVAPGWIVTDLTRSLHEDEARSAPILQRTPMGRWGQPEDVAGPAVFLCSEHAAFVTGTILPVDGGYAAC